MKLLLFYRTILFLALTSSFPAILIAGNTGIGHKPMNQVIAQSDPYLFADSIQRKKGEKDQDEKSKDKNSEDTRGNLTGDKQKPSIKEVPRSIPKLKPKAVTNRIPIKRLPIKIPKTGIRGIRF